MPKFKDLTGYKFGMLTVKTQGDKHRYPNGSTRTTWICECDCGNLKTVFANDLTSGKTISCGCYRAKKMTEEKSIDLTGKRFGKLTVTGIHDKVMDKFGKRSVIWTCLCDCGKTTYVPSGRLNSGNTRSCGCLVRDALLERNTKHGLSHTRINNVFQNMKSRCYDASNIEYHNYGGRGITICDEWLNDRSRFFEWAFQNGYDPYAKHGECTIERIDVNKGYSPENCMWADNIQQQNNTRFNRKLTYNGETHTVAQWARILGMNRDTLYSRIYDYGWSDERAITTPVHSI